jgi:vacuolar-type H+-ATPase subunit C/Vma6
VEGGRNPTVIQCLLEDSQQWNKLRSSLKLHVLKAQELWRTFKEHEALFMELAESEHDSTRISNFLNGKKESNIGELEAMVKLSRKVKLIEGCMEEIAELKAETKEMIELVSNSSLWSLICESFIHEIIVL